MSLVYILFLFLALLLLLILAARSSLSIFNFFVLLEFVCCGNCPSVDCIASLFDISVSCPPCYKSDMGLSSSIDLFFSPRTLHASILVILALSHSKLRVLLALSRALAFTICTSSKSVMSRSSWLFSISRKSVPCKSNPPCVSWVLLTRFLFWSSLISVPCKSDSPCVFWELWDLFLF